jgi:hypothetical protein
MSSHLCLDLQSFTYHFVCYQIKENEVGGACAVEKRHAYKEFVGNMEVKNEMMWKTQQ